MQRIAGLLFFIGGASVILGIMTAEIFYPPGYNVSLDMISSLAATPPPDSVVREPSAGIFAYSMILAGILIVCGAYFLRGAQIDRRLVISIAVMGVGAVGVGVFPAYHPVIHPAAALITFCAGSIAALFSASLVQTPLRYVAVCSGLLSLLCLLMGVIFPETIIPILGKGGTERWVAYPILLWLIGYGGYLMNVRKA